MSIGQMMKAIRKISVLRYFLLLNAILLNGCSEPSMMRLPSDSKIVAFGDSLTFGVGASRLTSYPEVLAGLSGLEVINAGISGETTSQGVKRFQSVMTMHNPDLVILLEGGNDILRNHSPKTIKQNLKQMILMAEDFGAQIILIGVPEKKLFSSSASWYAELAAEHELVFDGDILSDLLRSPKFKSDPIHLNAAGYQKFAERINELLVENGAL